MPLVGETEPAGQDDCPTLSVVVPASNEADKIEPALRALLEEDYPDLELAIVDDRSTDATGEIIDRVAAGEGAGRCGGEC